MAEHGTIGFVISFSKFLWALLFLVIIGFVLFLLYIIVSKGHLRMFSIGHSEPFDAYMESYMSDFFRLSKKANNKSIDSFISIHNDLFPKHKISYDVQKYSRNDLPYLYSLFVFYRAIEVGDEHELSLLDTFFSRQFVDEFYIKGEAISTSTGNKGTTTTISDISKLQTLQKSFNLMRNDIAMESKKKVDNDKMISISILDIMLNKYFDEILMSYNLRKTGGRSLILFSIYMREHTQFVFKETIPSIWKNFFKNVYNIANGYQKWLSSPEMRDYMISLPMKIAMQETFAEPEHEDVEEHFFQVFTAIFKVCIALVKILLGILAIIANPLDFFTFIIGLIVGVIIYVLYIIVLACSIFCIIPAFFYLLFLNIAFTLLWIMFYIFIAGIYLVLTLLDAITGGMILSLLRCENLPNAWATNNSYCHKNVYKRYGLICLSKCWSSFHPVFNLFCYKLPTTEPSYCPQQIIYNCYNNNFDQLKSMPYIYSYIPTLDYYRKEKEERKRVWRDIFQKRVAFKDLCHETNEKYEDIVCSMCHSISKNKDLMESNPAHYNMLIELCKLTYCDKNNDWNFCKKETDVINDEIENKDVVLHFTISVIILLSIIIGIAIFSKGIDDMTTKK